MNVVYAYRVEHADATDSAAIPAYEVAGVEAEKIEKTLRRDALDEELNAAIGVDAEHEMAVVKYLTS